MDLSPRYSRAIAAIDELLMKLRLEWTFVGSIARAAWLGGVVDGGSIDVVALMKPEQKNQVAMMASNRGFHVDREEIEADFRKGDEWAEWLKANVASKVPAELREKKPRG